MKVYTLTAQGPECGELYAFASKREAEKKKTELEKDEDYEIVYDVHVADLPISKAGILQAYEYGAQDVPK